MQSRANGQAVFTYQGAILFRNTKGPKSFFAQSSKPEAGYYWEPEGDIGLVSRRSTRKVHSCLPTIDYCGGKRCCLASARFAPVGKLVGWLGGQVGGWLAGVCCAFRIRRVLRFLLPLWFVISERDSSFQVTTFKNPYKHQNESSSFEKSLQKVGTTGDLLSTVFRAAVADEAS